MKSNRTSRRNMNFESMEKRELFAADLGMDLALATTTPEPQAMIFVKIPVIGGDSSISTSDEHAINGNSCGVAEIDFVEVGGDSSGESRAFVKSWSTSGDADDRPTEEVAFNKVAFGDAATADSFSFGVEREMKESGEKGGTEDINIGVGELQECTISKSMEAAAVDVVLSPKSPAADHFIADSFSFGVEREMKESRAKGGNVETTWKVEKGEK